MSFLNIDLPGKTLMQWSSWQSAYPSTTTLIAQVKLKSALSLIESFTRILVLVLSAVALKSHNCIHLWAKECVFVFGSLCTCNANLPRGYNIPRNIRCPSRFRLRSGDNFIWNRWYVVCNFIFIVATLLGIFLRVCFFVVLKDFFNQNVHCKYCA